MPGAKERNLVVFPLALCLPCTFAHPHMTCWERSQVTPNDEWERSWSKERGEKSAMFIKSPPPQQTPLLPFQANTGLSCKREELIETRREVGVLVVINAGLGSFILKLI